MSGGFPPPWHRRIFPVPQYHSSISRPAMGRLLLILLLVAGAVAINPTLRTHAQPYVQPALDPVYEWSTRSRLGEINRLLEADRAMGRSLPTSDEFSDYLRQQFLTGDGHLDSWGTPFYLRDGRRETTIGSAGRDGEPRTADDLTLAVAAGR